MNSCLNIYKHCELTIFSALKFVGFDEIEETVTQLIQADCPVLSYFHET